jgi:hypothetical protein
LTDRQHANFRKTLRLLGLADASTHACKPCSDGVLTFPDQEIEREERQYVIQFRNAREQNPCRKNFRQETNEETALKTNKLEKKTYQNSNQTAQPKIPVMSSSKPKHQKSEIEKRSALHHISWLALSPLLPCLFR